jgi:hypothetical protein
MSTAQPAVPYQRYQNRSIWVSSGSAASNQAITGSLRQLSRVQDVTYRVNYPLANNVYLDAGVESYNTTPPSVDVDIRWWHTNGLNEMYVGLVRFDATGQAIMGLDEEKNVYVAMEDTFGIDSIGAPYGSPKTVIGLGNALMTSYELGAQVGGLVEGRATLNCLTANVYTGFSGIAVPGVDPQNGDSLPSTFIIPPATAQYGDPPAVTGQDVAALSARDMFVLFSQTSPFAVVYTGQQACYLQSFNLGLTIDRQEQKPLGYIYPQSRPIMYPIQVNLTTDAFVSRYQADQLERLSCTNTGTAAQLIVKQPCSNLVLFSFYFDNLQVQSQTFTQAIGPIDRVSTQWRGWIRSPNDLFIDPFYNYLINTTTTGAYGTEW